MADLTPSAAGQMLADLGFMKAVSAVMLSGLVATVGLVLWTLRKAVKKALDGDGNGSVGLRQLGERISAVESGQIGLHRRLDGIAMAFGELIGTVVSGFGGIPTSQAERIRRAQEHLDTARMPVHGDSP